MVIISSFLSVSGCFSEKEVINLYQPWAESEAGCPSGKYLNFGIITTVYEDLVSQLTSHFSHAMIHPLFFYFARYKGVILWKKVVLRFELLN